MPIKGEILRVLGVGDPQNLKYSDCNPKRHICRSCRVLWVFMRQNRSMGLAWPRSREKKEKKKKSHTRSIFCQNSTSHGGATGYSIGTKFGRLVGPFDLITHANFKLDRLRTGCVELHEILPSFRFSALHRLSPLSQLGPAGPLVITHANFKLDRLRTGCVKLHESLPSFRFPHYIGCRP